MNFSSMISQTWPPASKFHVEDIPDLSGKVIIVTGANTGIGKETAKVLLSRNAKVYLACRNQQKAEEAIGELKSLTSKEGHFLKLDLSDLKAIKAAAEEFRLKESKLHVLFNNAGLMNPPMDATTVDGFDLQFGTNVLGHFYLTKLLLPVLLSTAKTDGEARVVNISSGMHHYAKVDFDAFKDGPTRRKQTPTGLYSLSKFGNVVFATELARRYGDKGIVSTSLHPGLIATDIARNFWEISQFVVSWIGYDIARGALTQLWAGVSKEGASLNGKYLIPWARVGEPRPDSQDPKMGKALWDWLEEQVKGI